MSRHILPITTVTAFYSCDIPVQCSDLGLFLIFDVRVIINRAAAESRLVTV